jgi:hypothetical protein
MTHRHDGVPCCWDCFASKPAHPGSAEDCPGWLACGRAPRLVMAPPAVRIALVWGIGSAFLPLERSRLCAPCLASGVVVPADDAPIEPVCRQHLAEERINDMLRRGTIKGWWT